MIFVSDKVRRNVLVSTDHGSMIVNRFDYNHEQVGHGQWLLDHGNTTTVEAQVAYRALQDKANPVIFDVGANIGTFSTWMAKVFPNGSIYCFEPQRLVFQMLCGNMALNNFDNCFIYNMGLGNVNSFIELQEPNYYKNADFGTFSLIEDIIGSQSGVKTITPIMTLDSFVETYKINRLDFIKIDAEGMDIQVLKGAEKTLEKYNPIIFIEHSDNRRSIQQEIIDVLTLDRYFFKVVGNNILATPN